MDAAQKGKKAKEEEEEIKTSIITKRKKKKRTHIKHTGDILLYVVVAFKWGKRNAPLITCGQKPVERISDLKQFL